MEMFRLRPDAEQVLVDMDNATLAKGLRSLINEFSEDHPIERAARLILKEAAKRFELAGE